jgi:hypothetical protein
MTCQAICIDGKPAIVCGLCQRPRRCCVRQKPSAYLCDAITAGGRTCSRALCADDRVPDGKDRDFCPRHARQPELPL